MALWLTKLRQIFDYKPGLKHKIRVLNIRRGPNLIALRDAGGFYLWFYGKLKLFLWAVSVSFYAASVAF